MAANINISRVFFRFLLVVFLCTTSAPISTAVAQNANNLDEVACSLAFTANEYAPQAAGDIYPQPVGPIEVVFDIDTHAKVIQGKVAPVADIVISGSFLGSDLWTMPTRSDSSGYYRVALGTRDCMTGNTIAVANGVALQVTVGAQTYATTARQFIDAVDSINNTVSGSLPAGLVVDIVLTDPLPSSSCDDPQPRTIVGTATADASNRFEVTLEDFSGRADAVLRVHDGDGTSILPQKTMRVSLNHDTGAFSGTFNASAQAQFTYTLKRAGEVIETANKTGRNVIYHKFIKPLEPGDVIEVSKPGQTLYHAVVSPFTASIDTVNDRVLGQTEPDQAVFIQFTAHNNSSQRFTHCFDNDDPNAVWEYLMCAQTASDGAFAVHAPVDIRQGDIANLTMYDAQGNAQTRMVDTGSLIHFDQSSGRIDTYFPTDKQVTLKAKDSQNTVLWQQNRSPGNNYLYWSLPYDLTPQTVHSIEITDGTTTKTMTVPDISIDPLYGQTSVSGRAPDGMVLIEHLDQDPDREKFTCYEGQVTGGSFSVTVDSQPISGIDEFWIIHSDGKGNFFTTARASRNLIVSKDYPGPFISGSVEQPGLNVTITHLRGESVISTDTFASSGGYFQRATSQDTIFERGDRLIVSTGGGEPLKLEIPELEGWVKTGKQKLTAYAPESARVLGKVVGLHNEKWVSSKFVPLNPTGNGYFEGDLPPLSLPSECTVSPTGVCLQIELLSYSHDGYLISWTGPAPSNVTADVFEPDDSSETAQPYEGTAQHHTVLAAGEEDWLRFDVAPEDVGRPITIAVSNLGWKMALDYEFSSSDGIRQRVSGSFTNEGDLKVVVKPDKPGTYFLKLKAAGSEAFYGSCDSSYDLTIHRPPPQWIIHLPLMIQN